MNKVITLRARGCGKTLKANKELIKRWPKGTIAFVSRGGIRYSEEANVEEI